MFMSLLRRVVSDRGSAVTEYAMVTILVAATFLGVLQLGFAIYVRNVSIDAAQRGAHAAAVVGGTDAEAARETRSVMAGLTDVGLIQEVTVTRHTESELQFVEVTVSARLPIVGPFGPAGVMQNKARALVEESLK